MPVKPIQFLLESRDREQAHLSAPASAANFFDWHNRAEEFTDPGKRTRLKRGFFIHSGECERTIIQLLNNPPIKDVTDS